MHNHLLRARNYSEAHRIKSESILKKITVCLLEAMKLWFNKNEAIFKGVGTLLREMGLFKQLSDFLSIELTKAFRGKLDDL